MFFKNSLNVLDDKRLWDNGFLIAPQAAKEGKFCECECGYFIRNDVDLVDFKAVFYRLGQPKQLKNAIFVKYKFTAHSSLLPIDQIN